MQSTDNRTDAQALPAPTIDMEGETAADFIEDIAELYTGVDRWHIRRLAAGLREPKLDEPEPSEPTTKEQLSTLLAEVRSAQGDAEYAAGRLEDTADRLEDALDKLKPRVVKP